MNRVQRQMLDISQLLPTPDEDRVYLDNAASTRPLPELLEALGDVSACGYVNPSATTASAHTLKRSIAKLSDRFRESAGLRGADLIWTAGGTEANNLALLGSAPANGSWIGREIVTTVVEHPSVDQPLRILEGQGAIVRRIPVDDAGRISKSALESTIGPSTHLVSVCLVQSEAGTIQDLVAVRECMDRRSPRALLHSDAVQALTKEDLAWEAAKVDLMSFSSHKFHALGGSGMLAVRPGVELKPIVFGGGQQGGIRSGSLDGIGIVSQLFAAITLLDRRAETRARISAFNSRVRDALSQLVPNVVFNSPPEGSPFILSASLPDYEGAVLMRLLDSLGVTIGTGSACSAGSGNPSQVLTAMGRDRKTAFGTIRISFGHTTTSNDVDRFLEALDSALKGY